MKLKTEEAQLVLDADDESVHNISEPSTVVLRTDFPSVGVAFSVPSWPRGLIGAAATVDIGGTVLSTRNQTGSS